MPAMWDNLKTTGNAPAMGPGSQPTKLVPPPSLKKRAFRNQTAPLPQPLKSHPQPRRPSDSYDDDDDDERTFWQNDFDSRLNGLGIQNGPYRYEIRRGKTVPRPASSQQRQLSPPFDSDDSGAPTVQPPPPRNPRRLNPNDWRPTSSVYVEEDDTHHHARLAPSKTRTTRTTRDMYGRPTALDISPPSSPDIAAVQYGAYADDVSPIDEGPDASQRELLFGNQHAPHPHPRQEPRSHIPTMRREKRAEQGKAVARLKESRSNDVLRDQSDAVFHPWEAPTQKKEIPAAIQHQGFGLTTTVTGPQAQRSGNQAPTFGQRVRQLARGKAEAVDSRPPWNGPSGRAPMVDPVRDDLAVAPLAVQRKPSKRGGRPGGVSPETSNTAASTVRRLLPSRSNQKLKEASKTPSPEPSSHGPPSHAYPSPPYNDAPISQSHAPVLPAHTSKAVPPLPPAHLPDPNKAIRRKPSPSTYSNTHQAQLSISSSRYSAYTDQSVATFVPHLSEVTPTSPFAPDEPWVPPPSRFSVTTCNTTVPDSPFEQDEEELPPMPPVPKQPPSVMDRRRPVPGSDNVRTPTISEPIVISMKSSFTSNAKPESPVERPTSIVATTKALPLAPPEKQSAGDRVAYLNARLESLAHRRININKSIKQMTELMPTDNLMSSAEVLRKREVEKKKVEGLKEELSEIQREEYDLGLKLYRANKRLERESDFEGSALWVRRATG